MGSWVAGVGCVGLDKRSLSVARELGRAERARLPVGGETLRLRLRLRGETAVPKGGLVRTRRGQGDGIKKVRCGKGRVRECGRGGGGFEKLWRGCYPW